MKTNSKIELSPKEIDTLAYCTFRYALGRMTYIVSDAVACITTCLPEMTHETKQLIRNTIEMAILNDDAGMDVDVKQWQKLRMLIDSKQDVM